MKNTQKELYVEVPEQWRVSSVANKLFFVASGVAWIVFLVIVFTNN